MGRCNQSGSKSQCQNKHARRLMMKIARHTKREGNVDGLERELARTLGGEKRSAFKTGRSADKRFNARMESE